MEPEGSLPHSQVSATCLYPEPDQSSPCPHPTSWRSILILSSHPRLRLPSGRFPSGFPHQNPIYTTDCPIQWKNKISINTAGTNKIAVGRLNKSTGFRRSTILERRVCILYGVSMYAGFVLLRCSTCVCTKLRVYYVL